VCIYRCKDTTKPKKNICRGERKRKTRFDFFFEKIKQKQKQKKKEKNGVTFRELKVVRRRMRAGP
jgi:hypothetical protein